MNISLNGSLWSPQLTFLLMQINICHKENVTHSKLYEPFDGSMNSGLAELWCPKIFDGLLCWDATPAGATAYQNCPKNVDGWKPDRIAFKKCNVHGKWFQHPESNKTWTNFTTCIDVEDLKFREAILVLDICYYTGSFSSLTVSIFIFFRYKLLNSLRTIVHSHLFAAHQLSSLCWIVWNFIMLTQPTFVTDFPIICLCLSFVRMYSTGCCYAWMFDESVIIYRYLVSIDNDDYKYYTTYKIIGWGIPLFLTINYYVARWFMGEIGRCTIDSSYAIYILAIPILIGMVISAWIFYKVCVVIFNKARSLPGAEGMVATPGTLNNRDNARTARAAAILFFLFGLHLLIMPTNPPLGTLSEKAYALFSGFIIGNQGTIFSCLFCFFNGEVKTRIRNVNERTKRLKEDINQISGLARWQNMYGSTGRCYYWRDT